MEIERDAQQGEAPLPSWSKRLLPNFEVDSYQIAVPNGECSVHLLVDRSASNDITWGDICSSILVDGGNDAGNVALTASKAIANTLSLLRLKYTINGKPVTTIQFDAWVITHWDQDHWAGALHMMQTSIIKESLTQQCKYFKYDQAGNPQTTLYCPNWTQYAGELGAPLVQRPGSNVKASSIWLQADANTQSSGMSTVSLHLPDVIHEKTKTIIKGDFIIENFCVAKWGGDQLLGIDFFSGLRAWDKVRDDPEKQAQYPTEEYPTEALISSTFADFERGSHLHRPWPKLLCVGCEAYALGQKPTETQMDKTNGGIDGFKEGTWSNKSSIISVLHFPSTSHISLYWAGDAVERTELGLIGCRGHGVPPFFKGYEVTVAKWSHHGSSTSSPKELWDSLRPRRCVVSASWTGNYLHPHPDVIKRFFHYCSAEDKEALAGRLFSMHYPGYLCEGPLKPRFDNWALEYASKDPMNFMTTDAPEELRSQWAKMSPIGENSIHHDSGLAMTINSKAASWQSYRLTPVRKNPLLGQSIQFETPPKEEGVSKGWMLFLRIISVDKTMQPLMGFKDGDIQLFYYDLADWSAFTSDCPAWELEQ